jgi:small-conductance mechanosensitive channel
MSASDLVTPVLVAVGLALAALLVRVVLVKRVDGSRMSENAAVVWRALKGPSLLWCVVLGLYGGLAVSPFTGRVADRLEIVLRALVTVSLAVTAANVLGVLVARFAERRFLAVGVTGLARTSVRVLTLTVGALIVLEGLGIAITPLLTALGVGGLAAALALQDSLANFFAGIHLLADKPIRVGDYVRLENGTEGFVDDIGWRSTRIRLPQGNLTVMPNAKLAQGAITNYQLPQERMSFVMQVSVGYGSDPEHVERVLVEEAMEAAKEVSGLLREPVPLVRFAPGFGPFSMDFSLICSVASVGDQGLVQHELRKRILRRFHTEGIEMPFPLSSALAAGSFIPTAH